MMDKIPQDELAEIFESYDVHEVFYDTSRWVTPDSMIYVFSDKMVLTMFYMYPSII